MNIEEFNTILNTTRKSGTLDERFFVELLKYQKIVLRGAGSFGHEIGRQLLLRNVPIDKILYWDIRADEIQEIQGIKVVQPFTHMLPTEKGVIIHCIPNGSLSGSSILAELNKRGYTNVINGMALFESAFCEMREETGYDPKICLKTTVCNWDNCDRLMHFVRKDCRNPNNPGSDRLEFQVIAFVLSLKCTLSCTHCGQYINTYALQNKAQHIPYKQIKHDIDQFFDAVDTVGFVSVIGGESFLHPDFDKIIAAILEKPNFGVLGITTNGVCKITQKHLNVLKNNRTRVIFSDYTSELTSAQKKLFEKNVKKVTDFGIHCTVGKPVWVTPPTLAEHNFSVATMESMKSGCNSAKTCQTVQQGKLYPCGISPVVHALDIGDYTTDYIDLSKKNVRQSIQKLHAQKHYQSCNHCSGGGEHLTHSGTQGYSRKYDHLLKEIQIKAL
jgi:hypothetical protein